MPEASIDRTTTRARRPMRRLTPIVRAALALLALYWPIAIAVLAVDPYDIYPWGSRHALPAMDTTENSRFLVSAAAKDPGIDLVMIGSSVSTSYTPGQMELVFPGVRHAWNMSYPSASPADRALTIGMFLQRSPARRYVIWMDWTYTLPPGKQRDAFPDYLYDANHFNDLRMVNQETIVAAWTELHGSGPATQGQALGRQREIKQAADYKAFQAPESLHRLQSIIESNRAQVAGPWRASCDLYPTLTLQLVPELHAFAQRHRRVDLVFPAYSAAAYYLDAAHGSGATLPEQLNFRRCVVAAVSNIPGVAVWAPDTDAALIADLGNYRNTTHLYAPDALMKVLRSIGDPAYRVDPGNVDAYLDRLRATVVTYDANHPSLRDGHPDGS